jgi:riboflavin synthase
MFTGIVEEVGRVVEARDGVLRIATEKIAQDTQVGDSIAINGVDLTVTDNSGEALVFNAMPETFRRSNLGELREGDLVNLERSVRPSDRLNGHIVRGVVEGIGTLRSIEPDGEALILSYAAPPSLLRYVVVKGPICIDGASLTVIDKTDDTVAVSLVQYTQRNTTHILRKPGDSVNLETDIIGRYVAAILEARGVAPEG